MTLDWRKARIARNEASFRDINERLERGLRDLRETPDLLEFVCECGRRTCEQMVSLSFDEYEGVRRDSRHFAIVPGHAFGETERVIAANDRYEVVEKFGEAMQVTDAADPRAPCDAGRRSGK